MSSYENVSLATKLLTAGTSACIADAVTFPLDTAKVRLQIQGEVKAIGTSGKIGSLKGALQTQGQLGLFGTISKMVKQEGVRSLYNGISAGLQRQMCFASVRIGLYDNFKNFYQKSLNGNSKKDELNIGCRILAGLTTGGLAVFIAQPTDVVKVRFQAAARGEGARYTSTRQAYKEISRKEGFRGLWKGTFPNVARNAIVNVSEIVCYDLIKDTILQHELMKDAMPLHFTSAVIAGFCTTVVASPVDVVKTRYMNSAKGQYKSAINCAHKMYLQEGGKAFYKGFLPSFYRLVSWNIMMWVTYEQMKIGVVKVKDYNYHNGHF